MKLILSRKGFDSSFGGCPSPIFEDGSFLSLPIPHSFKSVPTPDPAGRINFSDITGLKRISPIVEDLTSRRKKPVKGSDAVHLDPDLRNDSLARRAGWRPLFGQSGSAQSHLDNQNVGLGDLFLFFGWFRRVEQREGQLRFKPGAPDLQMLFGWLKVGDIWRVETDACRMPEWAAYHPHVTSRYEHNQRNTIYVADGDSVTYDAGTFRSFTDQLVLTEPGKSRSRWRLPKWFYPSYGRSVLSHHANPNRWRLGNEYAYLQSVAIGQEFVLDTKDYPEAVGWATDLIARNAA